MICVPLDWLALVCGLASSVLGVVVLAEVHREAPRFQRLLMAALILLCAKVALDGFMLLTRGTGQVDLLGTLFALVLTGGFYYRLVELGEARRKARDQEQKPEG